MHYSSVLDDIFSNSAHIVKFPNNAFNNVGWYFPRHCPMCLLAGDSFVILWIGPFHMVVSAFGQFWGSEWEF